jgi:hypothetical protein
MAVPPLSTPKPSNEPSLTFCSTYFFSTQFKFILYSLTSSEGLAIQPAKVNLVGRCCCCCCCCCCLLHGQTASTRVGGCGYWVCMP